MPTPVQVSGDVIRRTLAECGGNVSEAARRLNITRNTVRAHRGDAPAPAAMPAAKHEAAGPDMPAAVAAEYTPHAIDRAGWWLILSDIHAPYHDRTTLELAVGEARRRGAVGVLLNGDTLDSHEVSRHDRDPSAPRYVEEVETVKRLLAWLRGQLPRAELVAKEGNHEERLQRYIVGRAPALFGLEGIDLPSLLRFGDVGAAWVSGRRPIALGKLNVIHGHEYPGGAASPVNPARGLYLKARSKALCGHHHQTSEHHARDIRGRAEAAWSVGCACFLHPQYHPLNNWNHGFALVELAADGTFRVENRRVLGGKVV
jgi:hypothetical protein